MTIFGQGTFSANFFFFEFFTFNEIPLSVQAIRGGGRQLAGIGPHLLLRLLGQPARPHRRLLHMRLLQVISLIVL